MLLDAGLELDDCHSVLLAKDMLLLLGLLGKSVSVVFSNLAYVLLGFEVGQVRYELFVSDLLTQSVNTCFHLVARAVLSH